MCLPLILLSSLSVSSHIADSGPKPIEHCSFNYGIVQEMCESRGGRPGLSVLTSLLVSVDVCP